MQDALDSGRSDEDLALHARTDRDAFARLDSRGRHPRRVPSATSAAQRTSEIFLPTVPAAAFKRSR